MIVKSEVVLEFQKGDNIYRLSMSPNAPIGEIYDVGFQVIQKALELAQDAANKAQRPAQPEVSPDVVAMPHPTDCTNTYCEGS